MGDRTQSRIGDMGEGLKLQLHIEDDGDIIVCIMPKDHLIPHGTAELQFCASGGKSVKTLHALHLLYKAMEEDAAEELRIKSLFDSWHNTKNELLKGIIPDASI